MPVCVYVCFSTYVCVPDMGIVRVWICEVPEGHARNYSAYSAFGINLIISIITDTTIISALEKVNNSVLEVLGRKERGKWRVVSVLAFRDTVLLLLFLLSFSLTSLCSAILLVY